MEGLIDGKMLYLPSCTITFSDYGIQEIRFLPEDSMTNK